MESTDHIWRSLPHIDAARCTGCGTCVAECPTNAVVLRHGKVTLAHPDACASCDLCITHCPSGAIDRPFRVVFADERETRR